MLKCQNFEKVMTSELLINQELESEICEEELNRRLKSIGFTNEQIEKFIFDEQTVIYSRESDKSQNEKFMAESEFFSWSCPCKVDANKLTISELLLVSEEATNVYPSAMAGVGGYEYYDIVSEYARQMFAKGYNMAIKKLQAIGLEDDSIKKFIFAEWQVIRRVTFDDYEAVDAWGNPERFLI